MTVRCTPVPAVIREFDWRTAERALVSIGQPTVGFGVVISNGLVIMAVRTGVGATGGGRHTVRVTAADDYRWRGAMASVVAIKNGITVLGGAGLDADAGGALDQLLQERAGVDVVGVHDTGEIMLSVPTPSGGWLRVPATPHDDQLLVVQAASLAGCEIIFELLSGVPAFTEPGQLAGFVRVVPSPRSGQLILLIVRADAALAAWSRASVSSGAPR